MAKAAKSTRKPAKANKAVGSKKAAKKKVASKKKTLTKARVSSRKATTKKKIAGKKKATPKKAASAKRRPAKIKVKTKVKVKVGKPKVTKPKSPMVVAPASGMTVVKPTKSRLIKASRTPDTVGSGVDLFPRIISPPPPSPVTAPPVAETLLRVGQMAPDFELPADDGGFLALSDYRGQQVVLYFYPKDDTPGCTLEACAFRDGLMEIEERGAVVLGISVDPIGSHQMFREKFGLNFPLLSDENKQVVQAYGVWKEKTYEGRTHMTTERTTFVIDEDGRIAKIFPQVQVHGHFEEVLAAL